MPDIAPKAMAVGIRAFCRALAEGEPVFMRCLADGDATASECVDNVVWKVARVKGSAGFGWGIWTKPGAYYEAEHHDVWRRRSGDPTEVSPQASLPKRILLLPDANVRGLELPAIGTLGTRSTAPPAPEETGSRSSPSRCAAALERLDDTKLADRLNLVEGEHGDVDALGGKTVFRQFAAERGELRRAACTDR